MSVGGDGKGKHEKEPDPSPESPVDSAETAPVDEQADAVEPDDIPPYEAVTEVMRAIDPAEPPPDGPPALPVEDEATAPEEPDVPVAEDTAPADAVHTDESPTAAYSAVPPVEQLPVPPHDSPTDSSASEQTAVSDGSAGEISSRVKIAVIAGAAVAILGVFFAADMLSSNGSVPRGVSVAGVEIGGLSHDDAEARLKSELGARVEEPVTVQAGDQQLQLVPETAGLAVDWAATLDHAGSQPINPFTRIASFFTGTEIGVRSVVDSGALDGAVESIRAQTDRAPSEGDVVFEGTAPVGVTPAPGQTLDVAQAREIIESDWALGSVTVPVETVDVTVHQDEVDRVLSEVATPAVSEPVVFAGRGGASAVLAPDAVARVLSFEPDGEGALATRVDTGAATAILAPQLASTETPPKDASFALGGGAPTVVPGVVGELVQWPKTLEQLPTLLSSTDSRTTDAVYEPAQPALTTEGAQALGIKEVIGEYTTGGFEYASGVNIGLTADIVDGALVKPGETFSLNEYTGPRGTAQGFVESGIIDNGRPDRAVGGGISQFATTLYNAAYFGGMDDAGHTEHSYYISRYPEAREATVFEGAIDLKFTNPAKTGVVIESFATSSNVTVRLWGTKSVDVESITGSRSNPTSPDTVTLPAGSGCVASGGGPGFTASDTRVITDIASGNEISRNTRTVKYDPIPIVKCVSPEPDPKPAEPSPEPEAPGPPADDGE